jgi:hypothetical protein
MAGVRIAAHDRSVEVPTGWEARIFRWRGAEPVLHVASFALADGDGDFGAQAAGRMRVDDVFASLVEYQIGPKLVPGRGLFAHVGRLRVPGVHEFGPNRLQVARRGQLGCQRFFTYVGRPFCLYIVLQPGRKRPERLLAELRPVLETVELGAG